MKDLPLLVVRVLAGGALVAGFSVLSDALKPKMFAGLFAGAPSVATVSLLVTAVSMGPAKEAKYSAGMIAGAVGLAAYSLLAALLVKHLNAAVGSLLAWAAWVVPAAILFWLFLR